MLMQTLPRILQALVLVLLAAGPACAGQRGPNHGDRYASGRHCDIEGYPCPKERPAPAPAPKRPPPPKRPPVAATPRDKAEDAPTGPVRPVKRPAPRPAPKPIPVARRVAS